MRIDSRHDRTKSPSNSPINEQTATIKLEYDKQSLKSTVLSTMSLRDAIGGVEIGEEVPSLLSSPLGTSALVVPSRHPGNGSYSLIHWAESVFQPSLFRLEPAVKQRTPMTVEYSLGLLAI